MGLRIRRGGKAIALGAGLATLGASCAQIAGIEDWTLLPETPAEDADASVETAAEVSVPDVAAEDHRDSATADQVLDAEAEARCVQDAKQCLGAKLQTCKAGIWVDTQDCLRDYLCDSSTLSCKAPTCQPEAYQCVGLELQKCNSNLDGWTTEQTCASEMQCNASGKACNGPLCQAGTHRCTGTALEVCNSAQSAWELEKTCLTAGLCDATKADCNDPVCDAGLLQCSANLLQICNPDRTGWDTKEVCVGASLCDAGTGTCHIGWSCNAGNPGAGNNCGVDSNKNCCGVSSIPGGTFLRSYDGVSFTDNSNPASLGTFELNTYEVTVGRFRLFVEAGLGIQTGAPQEGAGAHPDIQGSGWQSAWNASLPASQNALRTELKCDATYATWTDAAGSNERKPINCVTWYEAFAFCLWDGGRLPTEAEWNYAAAGGAEQRAYPWGPTVAPTQASYGCMGDGIANCLADDLRPVGSFPTGLGKWGQLDLAGNVAEWTLDAYAAYVKPCTDCAQLTGTDRTVRGGGYDSQATDLYSSMRNHRPGATPNPRTGFRCAK